MRIGIDTSVLIGLLDSKDVWHSTATSLKNALIEEDAVIVVFDCVLAETISTIARRVHEKRRAADLDEILHTLQREYPLNDVEWLFPSVPLLYPRVIEMVRASKGELNFNDALIALSCQLLNIEFLASFDRDFDSISWLTRIATIEDLQNLAGPD